MKENVENELKTLVTKEEFEKLLSFYPNLEFKTQHNYYYTTFDLNHYAFRIRETSSCNIFTIKEYKNNNIYETETEFLGNFQDNPEIILKLNQLNLLPPYTCYGELVTQRAIYFNGKAELCFDINSYNGITDYEIEYEEKQPHDIVKEFTIILNQANIAYIPSYASKYKRCLKTMNNK